jgi:hypothetical protein
MYNITQVCQRPGSIGESQTMHLSFCTACKGRAHHLRQVYRANIEAGLREGGDLEFVLLNADSPDDMHEWVMDELRGYIRDGILSYYRATIEIPTYSIPVADNTVMRLAAGDAVSNLIADNLITTSYVREIRAFLSSGEASRPLACAPSPCDRGTTGRLALFKREFLSLGGYDERMLNWGYQDVDFVHRARASGMTLRPWARATAGGVIQHSNAERTQFQQTPEPLAQSNARNAALSNQAIRSGQLIANRGRPWGAWPTQRVTT